MLVLNRILCVAAALAGVLPAPALSQPYPSKPVRIVVAFPPGGLVDVVIRVVGERLSARLGQPFIVENRHGAMGNVASGEVAKAAPDGYTLIATLDTSITLVPVLYRKVENNPMDDLAPIAMLTDLPLVLVVHPSVQADTVQGLLSLARRMQPPMIFASGGVGSPAHLANEILREATGIEMLQPPYQGSPQAVTSVVANQTQATFAPLNVVIELVRSGKLKALAMAAASRSPFAPDLPTMTESGIPGMETEGWVVIGAPRKTPDKILAKLNREIDEVLGTPEVQQALRRLGLRPLGGLNHHRTAERIAREHQFWTNFVQSRKLALD
ncbi:MAG: Bug family tripartite tricarboxylate transporter substrate binding protein [Betaproteobacteria bacterium]